MKKSTSSHARLNVKIRLYLEDEIAFGPGKAELLEAIRQCGSISQAGKKMGMSYRRAWLLVDSMNRCFQQPLVLTSAGGSSGGGTQLTPFGEAILLDFQTLQTEINVLADQHFKKFQSRLREKPELSAKHSDMS